MTWTTALADMRVHLSDGATDKLRHRKRVLGDINGTNVKFKTFEFRRITDLTTATAPLGVYKNGGLVAVSTDDLTVGEFVLAAAPVDGDVLEATYYSQWFVDAEITEFLTTGSKWLGLSSQYANIPEGLQPAALEYGAFLAYKKLVLRWSEPMSMTYLLEDLPQDKQTAMLDRYLKASELAQKNAAVLRDDYYKRQGQSLAPNFGFALGAVRDVPPRA